MMIDDESVVFDEHYLIPCFGEMETMGETVREDYSSLRPMLERKELVRTYHAAEAPANPAIPLIKTPNPRPHRQAQPAASC